MTYNLPPRSPQRLLWLPRLPPLLRVLRLPQMPEPLQALPRSPQQVPLPGLGPQPGRLHGKAPLG